MHIKTTCEVAKSINAKTTTKDEAELVVASLGFHDATVSRTEVDRLIGLHLGWSECLFDELGAARFPGTIFLSGKPLPAGAVITLGKHEKLQAMNAELSKIELQLADKGFLLSGTLTWPVAGDETSDAEKLLGKLCGLELVIDKSQLDLFKGDGEAKSGTR